MPHFHRNDRAAALPARVSRTWLLVSAAADEETIAAALESEADSILLDLEDGCPENLKDASREKIVQLLENSMTAWVRINTMGTEHWKKDVQALNGVRGLRGVMLATTEHPDQVTRTAMMLAAGTPVIALIESAVGMLNVVDIARAPGTFRLAFGVGDYRRDTGVSADPIALSYARSQLVLASRAGELPGPIDGPSVGKYGGDLMKECHYTTMHGMTGKLLLDPRQAETINLTLAPSDEEIQWAQEMLNEAGGGNVPKDGSYLPRLARARKVSELAKTYGLWRS
ncbi:HpcH/HpaI aldolase/citrate lyase family protein [Rothia amarae]|uniref:HpcH/HpaI aldolase/citrate lyase family protein n=1 Tax=Rothia amarae TaxID=169480 RepID=UPI0009298082|nr:Putative citrate lyase/aldolase [Mycobacteroides abscessus subsp. abscessus]